MAHDIHTVSKRNPELIPGDISGGILFLCDHASNYIPEDLESLGLPVRELERHIAYDIGAADVTRKLADIYKAPAVLSTFSRLLIDPNRGRDDPTLVMKVSDGAIIPGNRTLSDAGIAERIQNFYDPYDQAIAHMISQFTGAGIKPHIISIHSFTPIWKGFLRPWEIGILWDKDQGMAEPLIASLRKRGLTVGDNEPYSGALEGDTLNRHATVNSLPNILVEVRQDLISTKETAEKWAYILSDEMDHSIFAVM